MGQPESFETLRSRRQWLAWSAASAVLTAWGCTRGGAKAPLAAAALRPEDLARLVDDGQLWPIVLRSPGGRGVLRRRARALSAGERQHLVSLDVHMRATLAGTGSGVGLAAPQVGISARVVLVKLGARGSTPKLDIFVNPRIVERSDDVELDYEGCLSIPDVCGLVRRTRSLVIEHGLPDEPARRLEVSGFDARIFQHEIDHLDGVLYIDRVEGGLEPMDQLKQLREELRKQRPQLAARPRLGTTVLL